MHRHVRVGGRVLRQIADQAFRRDRIFEHVESADRDFALRRGNEAGQHAHGGRFARAIRAEKAEHLAYLDGEGNAVHGLFRSKRFLEILNCYHAVGLIFRMCRTLNFSKRSSPKFN